MEIIHFDFSREIITDLLKKQLSSFFPPLTEDENKQLDSFAVIAIEKSNYNFSMSNNKYFSVVKNGVRIISFNPYHSIQWMTFLYYLSHELFLNKSSLCDQVYYLNKILHSVDLFYAIELPAVWSAEHPLASVMGRAQYSDGFFFYQGCTVGGTHDKDGNRFYPVIDENVHMFSNSSILGRSHIGKNVNIGAGCIVKNQDVPDNCTVFGESPNLIIKPNK